MVSRTSMLLALLVITNLAVFSFTAADPCKPADKTSCSGHLDACRGTCSSVAKTKCTTHANCTSSGHSGDKCENFKCNCPSGFTGDKCQTKSSSTTTRGSISCLMLMIIPTMIQLVRL